MKLDLGGGERKNNGWLTVDINPLADVIHNLDIFPYPFNDGSVSEMMMFHTLEHITYPLKTMMELYRIAKPNCIIEIRVPWWKYDMFTCPYHLNWFRPRWFYWLSKTIQKPVGMNDNITDMKWCEAMYHQHGDMDWRVMKEHITRGKHKFWKKYEYRIWLKACKPKRKEAD